MMPMERSIANATGVETRNCPDWRRGEPHRFGAAPRTSDSLPGGHSEREPPDPIPNSEVKTLCADGSVPCRHARVGHCQALKWKTPEVERSQGFFLTPSQLAVQAVRSDRADLVEARQPFDEFGVRHGLGLPIGERGPARVFLRDDQGSRLGARILRAPHAELDGNAEPLEHRPA